MGVLDSQSNRYKRDALINMLVKSGNRKSDIPFGTPGFDGVPREGVSARQPTAEEMAAFNEKRRLRSLMGSYGKGGLERERIGAENQRAALTSQNERAKLALGNINKAKDREKDLQVAKIKANGDGLGSLGGGTGAETTGTGLALTGKPVAMPNETKAAPSTQPAPLVPASSNTPAYTPTPRIAGTGADAEYTDTDGFVKPGTKFSNISSGTGYITVPEGTGGKTNMFGKKIGAAGTYAMNRAGQSKYTPLGGEAQTKSPTPDSPNYSPGIYPMDVKLPVRDRSLPARPDTPEANAGSMTPQISLASKGQPRDYAKPSLAPIYRAGKSQEEVAKWIWDLMSGRKNKDKGWFKNFGALFGNNK
jgi:hypothetical protein